MRSDVLHQRRSVSSNDVWAGTHGKLDSALIILDFGLHSRKQGARLDDLDVRELESLSLLHMMYLDI